MYRVCEEELGVGFDEDVNRETTKTVSTPVGPERTLVNPEFICVGVALVELDLLKVEVLLDDVVCEVFGELLSPVLNAIPVMDERTGTLDA